MEEVEVFGVFNCELKDIRVGLLWEMDLNLKAAVLHAVTGRQRIGMHFFCVAFPLGFFCEELRRTLGVDSAVRNRHYRFTLPERVAAGRSR